MINNPSPYKDNTIVLVWSDQGFHHGEKGHWGKHTLWQRTTQVPFIWAGKGIVKNKKEEGPVSLIDIYPTLSELCGLDALGGLEGVSLASALQNQEQLNDRNIFVPHAERGSYAVVNKEWRYISYNDGAEELYNTGEDPNEWNNLIGDESLRPVIDELKKSAPLDFAPSATPRNSLDLVVEGDSFHWEKK